MITICWISVAIWIADSIGYGLKYQLYFNKISIKININIVSLKKIRFYKIKSWFDVEEDKELVVAKFNTGHRVTSSVASNNGINNSGEELKLNDIQIEGKYRVFMNR